MRNFLIGALALALGALGAEVATAEPIEHQLSYGEPRSMEAGGSAGLAIGTDSRDFNVTPQIGFFIQQNFELSGIVSVSRVDTMDTTAFVVTALAEPSYHVPIVPRALGFLGLGVGGTWVQGLGGGLAIAPRMGANFLVGSSGIVTPSVSWQYSTEGAASQLRVNLGYTVMW